MYQYEHMHTYINLKARIFSIQLELINIFWLTLAIARTLMFLSTA